MANLICIDARMWGIKHTGIGRYIENLIDNLPESSTNQVVLIIHPDEKNQPSLQRFKLYFAQYHPYSYLAQFEMLWLLIRIRPRLLHVPHFTIPLFWPGKIIVTIHDLIKHQSRGPATTTRHPVFYWFKYFQYLFIVWFAVRRAIKIIVPAAYWKNIVIKKFHLPDAKVIVTYEGVSPLFSKKAIAQLDLPDYKPYVLYVGNVYPHKNIPVLLQAIKQLQGEILLIMVCARSVFRDRVNNLINELNISKWARFMGGMTDDQLSSLYQHASAFVFPSLIEGFGLPGLEAMAAGTPVIAARASCLPEIYGSAAEYFDPHDPADLAQKISYVVSDAKLRKTLILAGINQAKKYSWVKMASQTWQIYQNELL